MAQPSQVVPTVTMNVAGDKQQANLRDYLNVRIAPFLKKAIHESLDAEVEFPLHWLGEYLIRQSILFEGNPDSSKIQERFLYNHGASTSKEITRDPGEAQHTASTARVSASTTAGTEQPSTQARVSLEEVVGTSEDTPSLGPQTSNGVADTTQPDATSGQDTEMGGTS